MPGWAGLDRAEADAITSPDQEEQTLWGRETREDKRLKMCVFLYKKSEDINGALTRLTDQEQVIMSKISTEPVTGSTESEC